MSIFKDFLNESQDDNNKGWFNTLQDLENSYPNGENGWFAVVASSQTIWVWQDTQWVNTLRDGLTQSVNSYTGDVVLTQDDVLNGLNNVQFSVQNRDKLDNIDYTSIIDFGGVPNNPLFDNNTALQNAALSGKKVIFPEGDYYVAFSQISDKIIFNNNTCFIGQNLNVNFKISVNTTDQVDFFVPATNNIIENINISLINCISNSISNLYRLGSFDNFKLSNVRYDGGRTAVANWQPNLFITSENVDDIANNILIENCFFERIHWAFLKTNSSQSSQNNFKIINTTFKDYYRPTSINSPSGEAKNWYYLHCSYINNFNENTSYRHLSGCAGGNNHNFINCRFYGDDITECLHFEETQGISVVNCQQEVLGSGIKLLRNDVTGTSRPCTDVIITNNRIKGLSGNKDRTDSTGIWEVYDDPNERNVNNIIVENNYISGFDWGFKDTSKSIDSIISSNIIEDCNNGGRAAEPRQTISNNIFRNCTNGLESNGWGGMFGKNTFSSTPNILSSLNNNSTCLKDFAIIEDKMQINNGQTPFSILTILSDSRLDGEITIFISTSLSVRKRLKKYLVSWDGSNLSVDENYSFGSGNVDIDGIVNNSGKLDILLRNHESSPIEIIMDISFDGLYIN